MNWTLGQWQAIGRHVLSYMAGMVTIAVTFNLISHDQAVALLQHLNEVSDGVVSVAKGILGLAGILVPIYTALMAKSSASPNAQAKAVAEHKDAVTNGAKIAVIDAVSKMKGVEQVVANKQIADASGPKVVTK